MDSRRIIVRRFPLALALLVGTSLCSGAETTIRGVPGKEDVTAKLTRQVAALEARITQLEKAQAAINHRLDKADASDDDSGDDAKKPPGKSKGDETPDKGHGNGSGDASGGSAKNGGDLHDVPGKSSNGSGSAGN